jgi:hypothetical protein
MSPNGSVGGSCLETKRQHRDGIPLVGSTTENHLYGTFTAAKTKLVDFGRNCIRRRSANHQSSRQASVTGEMLGGDVCLVVDGDGVATAAAVVAMAKHHSVQGSLSSVPGQQHGATRLLEPKNVTVTSVASVKREQLVGDCGGSDGGASLAPVVESSQNSKSSVKCNDNVTPLVPRGRLLLRPIVSRPYRQCQERSAAIVRQLVLARGLWSVVA